MIERTYYPSRINSIVGAVGSGLISLQLLYYVIVDDVVILLIFLVPFFFVFALVSYALTKKTVPLILRDDGIEYSLWTKQVSCDFVPWHAMKNATVASFSRMNLIAIEVQQDLPFSKAHKLMYGNCLLIFCDSSRHRRNEICGVINKNIMNSNN